MSEYDRLGPAVRAMVGVPQERILVLAKIASHIAQPEGEELYRHLEGLVQTRFARALMPVPKPKEPPPIKRPKLRKSGDPIRLSACDLFLPNDHFRERSCHCSIVHDSFWEYFAVSTEERVPEAVVQQWSCGMVHEQRVLLELGEASPRNVSPAVLMHLAHVHQFLLITYCERGISESILPTFHFFVRNHAGRVLRVVADGWSDGWHLSAHCLSPKEQLYHGSIVVPVK